MNRQRWQDWATLVLGLWIIASPFLLLAPAAAGAPAISGIVHWNFYIVGLALAMIGIAALYSRRPWEEWTDVVLGVWLLISPWILAYTSETALKWDAVIVGLVVAVLAAWALTSDRREGRPA